MSNIGYDKASEMQVAAVATGRSQVALGMTRRSHYHVEAYSPLTKDELFAACEQAGRPLTERHFEALDKTMGLSGQRGETTVIPIARLRAFAWQWLPVEYHSDAAWMALFAVAEHLLWEDNFQNLVVNAGLDDSLDKHLKGSSYTAAWYVGLADSSPSFAAGDTMSSHAGWVDLISYTQASRPTLTLGSVSGQSVDNSANKAAFTVAGNNVTIGGAYVVTDDTKGGTSGTLYGGGAFTAGDKQLDDSDTLNVTVTCTASAS